MSIISRMRRQYAVYWAPKGTDEYGREQYHFPVEVKCRWDDTQESFTDAFGDSRVSNSFVYPDRAVQVRGYLRKGRLKDLRDPDTPQNNTDVFMVYAVKQTPNFRATEILHTAIL